MSELLNAYRTTAGNVFKKVRASDGRIMKFKNGTPIDDSAFNGGKKSLEYVITNDKGDLPTRIESATSLEELEEKTDIPFTATRLRSIEDASDREDRIRAETNRWLGFRLRNQDMDSVEAAKQYLEMRNRLEDAESPQERALIKSEYNLGGS